MDLFDHAAAQAAKKDGMQRSEAGADVEWSRYMLDLVIIVARHMATFTSDDVIDLYEGRLGDKPTTHDWRALGPVMKRAASIGHCRKTDRVVPSRRTKLHASPRAVWIGRLK